MDINFQIESLRQLTHELLHLGVDGSPIYSDRFTQLNKDVLAQADDLFSLKAANFDEEAALCLVLLNGYSATIYDCGNREHKRQAVLDRACAVLDQLSPSLLKCQLLTACYAEVFEEDLLQEAKALIDSWGNRELSGEEKEVIEILKELEENQYPNSEIE